jgi:deazaflavin-dependent oxidoreductase (nitroreductase family)
MSDVHALPSPSLPTPGAPTREAPTPHAPGFVPALNGLIRRLLALGAPMGPNALLTVIGRRTGRAITFPVAILELDGRRFVQGTFGETNWVRNLRANPTAVISKRGWSQPVEAVELSPAEAGPILRDALVPFVSKPYTRPLVGVFFRLRNGATLEDYVELARAHPTFELRPRTE